MSLDAIFHNPLQHLRVSLNLQFKILDMLNRNYQEPLQKPPSSSFIPLVTFLNKAYLSSFVLIVYFFVFSFVNIFCVSVCVSKYNTFFFTKK